MSRKIPLRTRAAYILAAWPNESLEEFAQRMDRAADDSSTRAGVAIGSTSVMAISAFWCGINLIMGAIASMPCIFYRRTGESSRERYRDHPLYRVLHDRANPYMTAHQWKRATAGHLVLWGNAYTIMTRERYTGAIISVEKILHPSQVKVSREKASGRLFYEITYGPSDKETLTREGPRFVFHIPGPGFNGITGNSLIANARESFGLTAAMEEFGARFFGQGVHAGGFLERPENPNKMSAEARDRLTQSIAAAYSGLENQGRYIVLEEGFKFNKNVIPLEDAQFLTSRTFQIDEVARWLNLSPARLKELSRATFSNIEQLQIMDLQDCFLPWCSLIEAELNAQLIEPSLWDGAFAEFNMDALLRADTVSRNNALAVQRQWGIINADEWRELDNRNPIPDGSGALYLVPTNYAIADKISEPMDATAPQEPSSDPPPEPDPALAQLREQNERIIVDVGNTSAQVDALSARMDALAAQRQPITIGGPTINLPSDAKKTRKTTTIKHDAQGQLSESETIEEPIDGE